MFIYLAALGLSCGMWDLVSWPRIEPRSPELGTRSLSHWTTREMPWFFFFFKFAIKRRSPPSSENPQLLLPKGPVKSGKQVPQGNQQPRRMVLRAHQDQIFPMSTRHTEAWSRRQCLAYCQCSVLVGATLNSLFLACNKYLKLSLLPRCEEPV